MPTANEEFDALFGELDKPKKQKTANEEFDELFGEEQKLDANAEFDRMFGEEKDPNILPSGQPKYLEIEDPSNPGAKVKIPSREYFSSEEYKKEKEAGGLGFWGGLGEFAKSTARGAAKMTPLAPFISSYEKKQKGEETKGIASESLESNLKQVASLPEAAYQGVDFLAGAGKTISGFAKDVTGLRSEEEKERDEYQREIEEVLKSTRLQKGKTATGQAASELAQSVGLDGQKAKEFIDPLVDQDIAQAQSIVVDPSNIITMGVGKLGRVAAQAYKAGKAEKLLQAVEKVREGADALDEARALGIAGKAEDVAEYLKQNAAQPAVKSASESTAIFDATKRLVEPTSGALENVGEALKPIATPFTSAAGAAGRTIRSVGETGQKIADFISSQKDNTIAGIAAAGAVYGTTQDPLAAIGGYFAGTNVDKLSRPIAGVGQKIATVGDVIDSASKAAKAGGGERGLRLAASKARGETKDVLLSASGMEMSLKPTTRMLSSFTKMGVPALDVADDLTRAAAVGGGLNVLYTGDLDSFDEGAGMGVGIGLGGRAFSRVLGGSDLAEQSSYINEWAKELPKEVRDAIKDNPPQYLAQAIDFTLAAKQAGADVQYLTPQQYRETLLRNTPTGQALNNRLQEALQLRELAQTPEESKYVEDLIQGVESEIQRVTNTLGFVPSDIAGVPKAFINTGYNLSSGQAVHEVGHLFQQIEGKIGDEDVTSPIKEDLLRNWFGGEIANPDGTTQRVEGIFSEQQLADMADRYQEARGADPVRRDENGGMLPEDREYFIRELDSEAWNNFAKEAMAKGKTTWQYARDVISGKEKYDPNTSAGSVLMGFKNDAETQRLLAERMMALDNAQSFQYRDSFTETSGDAVLTADRAKEDASIAIKALEEARNTGDVQEVSRSRQAIESIADSGIYETELKKASEILMDATELAAEKLGRQPSVAEVQAEFPNVFPKKIKLDKNGQPKLKSPKQAKQESKQQFEAIKQALKSVGQPDDPNAVKTKILATGDEAFEGRYFTPEQIKALRQIDPSIVPKRIVDNIINLNKSAERGAGGVFDTVYQGAIRSRGNIPRSRRKIAVNGFYLTPSDNVIARSFDVTGFERDAAKEFQKKNSKVADVFRGLSDNPLDAFLEKTRQYLDNHTQGLPGETNLGATPKQSVDIKNAINAFLGGGNRGEFNPLTTDNNYFKSFRGDRMFNLRPTTEKMQANYGKIRLNLMPKIDLQKGMNQLQLRDENAGKITTKKEESSQVLGGVEGRTLGQEGGRLYPQRDGEDQRGKYQNLVGATGEKWTSFWDRLESGPEQVNKIVQQESELIENAKKSGIFIPREDLPKIVKGQRDLGGNEHEVYKDGNTYYRLTKNGMFGRPFATPEMYLKRWDDYNANAPKDIQVELVGITQDHQGNAVVVTKQPAAKGKIVSPEKLREILKKQGWEPFFGSDGVMAWRRGDVVMEDVHNGNVLVGKKEELYPIDVTYRSSQFMPKSDNAIDLVLQKNPESLQLKNDTIRTSADGQIAGDTPSRGMVESSPQANREGSSIPSSGERYFPGDPIAQDGFARDFNSREREKQRLGELTKLYSNNFASEKEASLALRKPISELTPQQQIAREMLESQLNTNVDSKAIYGTIDFKEIKRIRDGANKNQRYTFDQYLSDLLRVKKDDVGNIVDRFASDQKEEKPLEYLGFGSEGVVFRERNTPYVYKLHYGDVEKAKLGFDLIADDNGELSVKIDSVPITEAIKNYERQSQFPFAAPTKVVGVADNGMLITRQEVHSFKKNGKDLTKKDLEDLMRQVGGRKVSYKNLSKDITSDAVTDQWIVPDKNGNWWASADIREGGNIGINGDGELVVTDGIWTPVTNEMAQLTKEFKGLEPQKPEAQFMPVTKKQDNAYLDAVKRGDMESAQKMVDEAAKRAGYDVEAYHGTPNKFNEFSHKTQNTTQYGHGFYFVQDKEIASDYANEGGRILKSYLSINKPLSEKSKPFTRKQLENIIEEAVRLQIESSGGEILDYKDTFLANYVDTYSNTKTKSIAEAANLILSDRESSPIDQIGSLSNSSGDRKLIPQAVTNTLGYDGIVVDNFQESGKKVYVAWQSNQIKLADPVTYDDAGNVIPLSERFNEAKDDIRFMPEVNNGSVSPKSEKTRISFIPNDDERKKIDLNIRPAIELRRK